MRPIPRRRPSTLVALIAAFTFSACTVEAGDEAAHAIAAKFAGESALPEDEPMAIEPEAAPSAPPIHIVNSPDAHARAEEEKAAATQDERHRTEMAAKESARLETERLARAQREAEEAEMLARAQAEAKARKLAEQKAAEDQRRAELAAMEEARTAEERRICEERKRDEATRLAAEKAEAERRLKAQREAEEAEMRARARAEAEERRMEEERRLRALVQARAEAERRRAAEKAEKERARLAEEERERQAAEAKRLAEIAVREQERKAADARKLEEENRRRAEEERLEAIEAKHLSELAEQEIVRKSRSTRTAEFWRRFEEEERGKVLEAEQRAAEAQRRAGQRAAEARRAAALRQLEEEGRRRAEQARAIAKLSAAEEARNADLDDSRLNYRPVRSARESWADQRENAYATQPALGGSHAEDVIEPRSPGITRVTVLLVMEPGRRGIRRFNKTADPILCVGAGCYISNGAGSPAQVMRRAKAFGPVVAIGTRAGTCSSSLTCVFRSVDLERPRSEIQPIDLRILRHDRRQPSTVMADPTCRTDGNRLTCSRTVVADDYRMWIVPETVAERAGAVALEYAVRAGLVKDGNMAQAGND